MSVEELQKDSEEISQLLSTATRKRVKDALVHAKAEIDREIVTLEIKSKQAQERKEQAPKRHFSELTEYGWDQSDKFVKIFITLGGVQNLDESSIATKFTENSLNVHVSNLNGKDYGLVINNLLEPIDVVKSYRKIKTGMIAIYLKKANEGRHWSCLTSIHKKLKDQQDIEMKSSDSDNPSDALVNIMKKMYQSGDSKTKQMIAKAWTESQEKIHKTDGGGLDFPSI